MTPKCYNYNNTTSTSKDLDNALNNLTEIFLENEYPESLIKSKIGQRGGKHERNVE